MTVKPIGSLSPRRAAAAGMVLCLVACHDAAPQADIPAFHAERPAFDGAAAFELLERQVAFGPRIPGTEGHAAQLRWMTGMLDTLADTVVVDTFTHHARASEELTLYNVTARFQPAAERRLLFLTHWDTRPRSDAASPPRDTLPVPGADDGASGTAVLLQLARLLKRQAPAVGIDLLFVDGEDYGPGTEDMFLGAERFVAALPDGYDPSYAVLLDMVGDADPAFPVEANSAELAPQVVQRVWGVAQGLGYGRYFPLDVGPRIGDDHIPLNRAGIPTVDIIDFTYGGPSNPYWHTPDDVPANTSPRSLEIVGEVVAELAYLGG